MKDIRVMKFGGTSIRDADCIECATRIIAHAAQNGPVVTVETRDYDLLWEATQDRLHQKRRAELVPGLSEALAIQRLPGLLGLALSGSGPSVVALAIENFGEISDLIVECFHKHQLETTVRLLEVDHLGLQKPLAVPAESRVIKV